MDKQALLRKLDAILDEAARDGTWGSIEIEFQYGKPTLLRELKTEKLQDSTGGNTRAGYQK